MAHLEQGNSTFFRNRDRLIQVLVPNFIRGLHSINLYAFSEAWFPCFGARALATSSLRQHPAHDLRGL